jgi:hypothetical protein
MLSSRLCPADWESGYADFGRAQNSNRQDESRSKRIASSLALTPSNLTVTQALDKGLSFPQTAVE